VPVHEAAEEIPPVETHPPGSPGSEFALGRVKIEHPVQSGPVVVLGERASA
jgi:hypothetical protein